MLFNSYEFLLLFLPITLIIYFYLNSLKLIYLSKIFLVVASLFFYSWWNPIYLPLILGSMIFNFYVGKLLGKKSSKNMLIFGIVGNIALLGYFKYADFFIENFNWVLNTQTPLLHLALPLAISYFTFQQIAFLVDNYRGEVKEFNFLNYSLFITFFPQLLMGPIVHHKEMMPQFALKWRSYIKWENISLGLFIFAIGLAKKSLIGDPLTNYAQYAFDNAQNLTTIEAWYASTSYVLSYYFDLSGYADMAIGIAKMFNIDIPRNFNSPYKARNFADYWRRWHITLSRFLSDYIYKSLGGNKNIVWIVYLNIMITFFVSGFWHGAGWTFIVWGLLNGLFVIFAHIMKKANLEMNLYLAWFLMFIGLIITRTLFVAKDFSDAWYVIKTMFNPYNLKFEQLYYIDPIFQSFYIVFGLALALGFKNSGEIAKNFKPNIKYTLYTAILISASLFTFSSAKEFLYFQF
ncbi:membrane-bound O-acyltransferase family protein [Aliarcobacter trophiarum LMG 25534]|uniref:Membrane-bound O-acyl transferase, MBOAT family n=1 Tax=Aliarcobacter trophiarum LMG 25534 TaxID=1032241 RepID=A0AAD0QL18_9BACT|nr:MBOAT family O-acyltransferase [Aliarcobacter trophiarum]AXK48785.1 membrane-bound O-acyl transferase, MBOAT family [Aliarcobacter trophiarum LMG 25534]RXJ92106.1 membrane-bound O-acyltransferase family protein [Aliarcobacter trophiarum LMG 25534]